MTYAERAFHDAILRRHFELFLRRCLMTLNPGQNYLPNWHIQAIAHQLKRMWRGEITRLIINMPPRHLKSLTVSVAFPAFLLGHEPWHRIFVVSYGSDLSSKSQRLPFDCRSRWYRRRSTGCELLEVSKTRYRPPLVDFGNRHRSMEP